MPTTVAIASTVSADESNQISLAAGSSMQVYCSPSLKGGESVNLERTPNAGTTWVPVNDTKYGGKLLSREINSSMVLGPGEFRLKKTATSEAVTVWYDE